MSEFDDIDNIYLSTSTDEPEIPPGEYLLRAVGASRARSRNETPGIVVRFTVMEGTHAGRVLFDTCWMTPAASKYSKQRLELIGFEGLKPSEICAMRDFSRMPPLITRVAEREFEGSRRPEIQAMRRQRPPSKPPQSGREA